MSTSLILRRLPLTAIVSVPILDEKRELAQKANDKLGYDRRLRAIHATASRTELIAKLAEIGIRPFTAKSVDTYKKYMVLKTNRVISGVRGILIGLQGGALTIYIANSPVSNSWLWLSIPAILFGFYQLVRWLLVDPHGWYERPIQSYSEPIPEDVLREAIRIKDHIPESHLGIEQLMHRERIVDPFLYVQRGSTKVYVAVWDEPNYEIKVD